jgi:uncharacterized membrane protein required for colicin V production
VNILDVILIVLLLISIWRGYRQGLVGQLVRVVSLALSFVVAFLYYRQVAAKLAEWVPLAKVDANSSLGQVVGFPFVQQVLYNIAAFALLSLAVGLTVRFIGGFLNGAAQLPVLSLVNQLAGGAIAFVKSGLILFLILTVATLLPIPAVQQTLNESLLASYVATHSSDVVQWVKEMIQNPIQKNGSLNLL